MTSLNIFLNTQKNENGRSTFNTLEVMKPLENMKLPIRQMNSIKTMWINLIDVANGKKCFRTAITYTIPT